MICRSGATGARRICGALICSAVICAFPIATATAAGDGACDSGPWARVETASLVDARTILLGDGRAVRLAGLEGLAALARDPATADAMDEQLTRLLSHWLTAMPLRIRILPGKPDRHGRRAALIMAGDELLQERLLDAGLAVFMPGKLPGNAIGGDAGDACARRLLGVEAAARIAGRGGWSDSRFSVAAARPDALSSQFGHFVIFQGMVQSVGTRRDRTYIDFGEDWSNDVTVEILAAKRRHFGGEAALEALTGKIVRVRGFLQEKAGPMVSVKHPAQIEVLADSQSR